MCHQLVDLVRDSADRHNNKGFSGWLAEGGIWMAQTEKNFCDDLLKLERPVNSSLRALLSKRSDQLLLELDISKQRNC
jgi:hypothetical protein